MSGDQPSMREIEREIEKLERGRSYNLISDGFARLQAENLALRFALQSVEWQGSRVGMCPGCHGVSPGYFGKREMAEGHFPGCHVAAALNWTGQPLSGNDE